MNIENGLKLIARIEKCKWQDDDSRVSSDHCFNMYDMYFACGSPACVSGHCEDLMEERTEAEGVFILKEYLEISLDEALNIFHGDFSVHCLVDITVEETVTYLKGLVDKYK